MKKLLAVFLLMFSITATAQLYPQPEKPIAICDNAEFIEDILTEFYASPQRYDNKIDEFVESGDCVTAKLIEMDLIMATGVFVSGHEYFIVKYKDKYYITI
jgi:hypothetical protein